MMKYHLFRWRITLCASFFIFISLTIFSQSKSTELRLADLTKELSAEHEDSEVALIQSKETVVFGVDKANGKMTVSEKIENQYLGLKENINFYYVRFYDETSEVKDIELRDLRRKKIRVYERDEYYSHQDYFHTDARIKYIKVTPPKGETYLLNSTKQYSDVKYFTKSQFSSHVPVVKKIIEYIIPDEVDVELREYNFEGFDIKSKVSKEKNGTTVHTYTVENLAPSTSERNSPGGSHILPHILILPKSFKTNSGTTTVFKETKDLYKWYRSLVQLMENDVNGLKDQVEQLIAGANEDTEKVKRLFYWVQDNIRYIAFEDGIAGFKPDECQNVYKKKYGDCKGMANLLKEMLILAGFDARLTWIGTNHIPYDYSTPSLAVDNHMICTLILDGKKYYLDPTEKYNPFGYNATRIQGKQVLIEDGEDFILEKVPTFDHAVNLELIDWKNIKIDGNKIVGKGHNSYAGERLTEILYSFNNIKSEDREDAIKRLLNENDKNFIVGNIEHSDPSNRDQQFKMDYDIQLDNMVSSFEDEIYLELDYYKDFGQSKFEDRKTDYVFSYKFNMHNRMSVEIPTGYRVEELPEGITVDNDYFRIETAVRQEANAILYEKKISLKKLRIPVDEFPTWNTGFKKLSSFYQEQAVLTKDK